MHAALRTAAGLLLLAPLGACDGPRGESPPVTAEDIQSTIQELYDRAVDAGEDVPADAYDWAREDLERIGDWEYQVLRLPDDDATLGERLNELGGERWEAWWLEREGGRVRVFLKRPARSYLRMLPLSELSRLVPSGSSE